jgi:two-component system, OmpR family, sensor histidine kinase TrcS
VPGLGNYRVDVRLGDRDGELFVTGVSTRAADRAVNQLNVIVYSLTALTVLATGLGTLAIVRYALRPLGRVTSTAAEVAALPLDRDNYAINLRVPESATDPRTEVGLVGHTLNRLLVHVGGALAEVAASDRRMRQFITDASHELRTPLAAILGHAELTRQDSTVLPENTEYALARIESESKRMNALVSELLLLARLDEGDDLRKTDIDLTQVVCDAVNDTAVTAPTHDWVLDVGDEPLWCRGDDAKMHQALANLLSNARIHTPPGTTVTTAVRALHDHSGSPAVEITITDDGPGIAPDLLPHLFERFVRADTSRSRQAGGTGLGLAIVASIVEAHGGEISAESDLRRTTFRIVMPAAVMTSSNSRPQSLAATP